MKKLILIFLVVAAAAAAALVVYKTWTKISEKQRQAAGQPKNSATKKAKPISVVAVKVQRRTMTDSRMFSGSLRAWSEYDVAPKVGGRLIKSPFNLGDRINGGTLIAAIDDEEYRQQHAQAVAEFEVAEAQLLTAEVNYNLRKQEFDRQVILSSKNIGSQAQYDSANSALLAQKAAVTQKKAELAKAAATRDNAKTRLNDTRIIADWPVSAKARYVGKRYVDEGALLKENQSILSILEIDRLKASFFVIERYYPRLHIAQEAELTTDAYPGQTFKAQIYKISQLLQENSRQAQILLEVKNPELRLKPGMFVRASIEFARHENTIVVPQSALLKRNNQIGVFSLDKNGSSVKFIPVKTGIMEKDSVEIIFPALSRPVITLGNHLLTDGAAVIAMQKSGSK